jgi:hypothetical protein
MGRYPEGWRKCFRCGGSGKRPQASWVNCGICDGKGQYYHTDSWDRELYPEDNYSREELRERREREKERDKREEERAARIASEEQERKWKEQQAQAAIGRIVGPIIGWAFMIFVVLAFIGIIAVIVKCTRDNNRRPHYGNMIIEQTAPIRLFSKSNYFSKYGVRKI